MNVSELKLSSWPMHWSIPFDLLMTIHWIHFKTHISYKMNNFPINAEATAIKADASACMFVCFLFCVFVVTTAAGMHFYMILLSRYILSVVKVYNRRSDTSYMYLYKINVLHYFNREIMNMINKLQRFQGCMNNLNCFCIFFQMYRYMCFSNSLLKGGLKFLLSFTRLN